MNIQNRHFLSKINGVGYNKPQPEQLNEQAGSIFPSGQLSKVLSELSPSGMKLPQGRPFSPTSGGNNNITHGDPSRWPKGRSRFSPSAKYASPPVTGGPLYYRPPTKGTKFSTSNVQQGPVDRLPPPGDLSALNDFLANWDENSDIGDLLAILGNWGNDPQLSTYENRQYPINKQLTEAMMVLNEKSTIQPLEWMLKSKEFNPHGWTQDEIDHYYLHPEDIPPAHQQPTQQQDPRGNGRH